MVMGNGVSRSGEEGWDSSTVIIQKYFLHNLLLHLASCSRVLCTGSDTAQIEKA